MRYIKAFEGKETEMTLEDLYYILFTIEDDSNYYVTIQSATRMEYDLSNLLSDKDIFRFKRYMADNVSQFKIKIYMNRSINYKKLIDLMTELYPIITRIESYGWYLYDFDTKTDYSSGVMGISNIYYTFMKNNV